MQWQFDPPTMQASTEPQALVDLQLIQLRKEKLTAAQAQALRPELPEPQARRVGLRVGVVNVCIFFVSFARIIVCKPIIVSERA